MNRDSQPWLSGALLAGCAVFVFDGRAFLLTALMLFLPLLDRRWSMPAWRCSRAMLAGQLLCLLAGGLVLFLHPEIRALAISTLLLAALPEEWFFRAYFMYRLEQSGLRPVHANLGASLLFALLHVPLQGVFGLSVFFPSLFFGWIYQRSRDLLLVILLHALSNLVFFAWLKPLVFAGGTD